MSDRRTMLGQLVVIVGGISILGGLAVVAFLEFPSTGLDLLGLLLVGIVIGAAVPVLSRVAESRFPTDNVAEVELSGPISRDGGGSSFPPSPGAPSADSVVESIERATDDPAIEGLVLHLNTPGGEIVPSDDIRRAADAFEGPVIAYTTDVCASGGYWIASACDELWAREASVVGSIGVRGSRVTASELLDRVGLSYEQFTAGEYKEAGGALAGIDENERDYLQGLIDGFYELFVETVAEGRELEPELIRKTEARVYLGGEALEMGLVDAVGTREEVLERLEEDLEAVSVRSITPGGGLRSRLSAGMQATAYALGAGLADGIAPSADDEHRFRF
jgi:protease-4